MMPQDGHGVDPSTFTPQGRASYAKDCLEIAATRHLQKSPYGGVWRLHCTDGYIEIRCPRSAWYGLEKVAAHFQIPTSAVDGYVTGLTKAKLKSWLDANQVSIYDIA